MQGEVYDVDSAMLNRLDELEEHPAFYERTEEEVLLAPMLKPGKTFEEVIRAFNPNIARLKRGRMFGSLFTWSFQHFRRVTL